jgi:hypothetical protein
MLAQAEQIGLGVGKISRLTAVEHMANGAMHLQIGIAANRRGEMRIRFQRQPEMTGIPGYRPPEPASAASRSESDGRRAGRGPSSNSGVIER